jgi:non-specific serine/threonine protein kinase/serine/threonine-protein kinase
VDSTGAAALNPGTWERAKAIVADALELESPTARASFVSEQCANNGRLRAEVESLLAQTTVSIDTLAGEASAPLRTSEVPVAAQTRIGSYEVVKELGRGGMGAVYLGERADGSFHKQVAIKVLKRGTDTDEVLRRFKAEREILARLDHPNIARLIDGGETAAGLPYFVMDYVDGKPITAYCNENQLTVPARLALFQFVCSAVTYAHQNLVVHRDLKPSNILVTDAGVPKLVDFGIAKIVAGDATPEEVTMTALRVMTPEYASPEQVRGEPVTTVTDVYSLGVVLYELLTGTRPYKASRRAPEEMRKAISEQEPERPSTVVAKTDKLRNRSAGNSSGSKEKVARRLRGDLDNIVLKALRKDPQRRYASANQLSEDIRRYLTGLPVRARRDTFTYRASKFIARNKLGVGAAAALGIAVLAGLVSTVWQARRASHESANARARFDQVRRLAHNVLFDYHDNIAALPGSTAIRQRLVKDALQYLDELSHSAGADAGLLREIATAYAKTGQIQGNSYYDNLGDGAGAMQSYRKSLTIRERLATQYPNDLAITEELADSHEGLGDMSYTIGDLSGGLASYERATPLREALHAAEPANLSYGLALAELYGKTADIKGLDRYPNLGDIAGALVSYEQADALLEAMLKSNPAEQRIKSKLGNLLNRLGYLAGSAGDTKRALAIGHRAVDLFDELAAGDPSNQSYKFYGLAAAAFLRFALLDENQLGESIGRSRNVIAQLEAMVQTDPKNAHLRRSLAVSYNALGADLLVAGDAQEALLNHQKALVISDELLARDPQNEEAKSDEAFGRARLGEALARIGDCTGAINSYRTAIESRGLTLQAAPNDARAKSDLSLVYSDLARALVSTGEENESRSAVAKAVAMNEELSRASPTNVRLRAALAMRYTDAGYVHQRVALASKLPPEQIRTEWQAARDSYATSLATWNSLRAEGKLVPANAQRPATAEQGIAECDAALR